MPDKKYAKYIVTGLKGTPFSPEFNTAYAKFAKRLFWLDDKVVSGAFNFTCAWYLRPPAEPLGQHTHDFDELLGFFGGDPENPYDLGGEVEFWLEDEKYILTKSCLIFLPRGLKHCPMIIKRVDRPIFHLGASVK